MVKVTVSLYVAAPAPDAGKLVKKIVLTDAQLLALNYKGRTAGMQSFGITMLGYAKLKGLNVYVEEMTKNEPGCNAGWFFSSYRANGTSEHDYESMLGW